ncbi:hypothetical protein [Marinobacter sp.]|jgi:hypothetical protein|uniref:hypothetical protein n=1 Tax=Marinobacter sp. TaxID=50741 RepID=UPI000C8F229F|nr:hypothetical protein [Marinobacter sp.]MAK48703.1 hypothetical protein [Marinobacter sp.]|tara:strand:+ start:4479 stop:5072 length:594 start_codon:yes stop_codon:yes gene_type:complete
MDRRVQNNLASTQAIRKILLAIIQTPSQFCEDEDLQKSLKSQGGIAKLEYETVIDQKNVHKTSMSLNTLKRYADELFDRGFEDLDQLRIKALEAAQTHLDRERRPDSRSRVGLQLKVKELEEDLEKHRSTNFLLLQTIASAMAAINGVRDASTKELREKRAREGLDRIRAIVSLNPYPFDQVNPSTVVSLKDFKNEK